MRTMGYSLTADPVQPPAAIQMASVYPSSSLSIFCGIGALKSPAIKSAPSSPKWSEIVCITSLISARLARKLSAYALQYSGEYASTLKMGGDSLKATTFHLCPLNSIVAKVALAVVRVVPSTTVPLTTIEPSGPARTLPSPHSSSTNRFNSDSLGVSESNKSPAPDWSASRAASGSPPAQFKTATLGAVSLRRSNAQSSSPAIAERTNQEKIP